MASETATLSIAAVATAAVIARPWNLPEAIWAIAGAILLVAFGLLPLDDALAGIAKGTDVYLFLIGMMLLAELARKEGLFDWLATHAVGHARGSPRRLFALIYGVGIVVTTFLSNDATAVVLTPAVYAAARAAGAEPLPYLLICAFIANAASFMLPISNPANLVVFGAGMPPLALWLSRFILPSIASIALTFVMLRLGLRGQLRGALKAAPQPAPLTRGGALAALGIGVTALGLLAASALGWRLGLTTFIAAALTATFILIGARQSPWPIVKDISWSVLPLVAGLFVLVEALDETGVIAALARTASQHAARSIPLTAAGAGALVAFACNLMNNLPLGLIVGSTVAADHLPQPIAAAALIGVDLGPNLSITGSLATILWLVALRREGEGIGAWGFLKLGAIVMPPALIGALLTLMLTAR
ncbi:MAG TPA: arsenic transporter [Roseiarcus sp.]|nr:arsenic transporter [Roseiarcus sp.]